MGMVVARVESFTDDKTASLVAAGAKTIASYTVGYDYAVQKNTTLRVEYRMDSTDAGTPFGSSTGFKNSQNTITAGLVSTF